MKAFKVIGNLIYVDITLCKLGRLPLILRKQNWKSSLTYIRPRSGTQIFGCGRAYRAKMDVIFIISALYVEQLYAESVF